jgi:hypothetical protein
VAGGNEDFALLLVCHEATERGAAHDNEGIPTASPS